MLTVAIANARAGVGKTTLTLGLAEAAGRAGQRVLVVDLDPQAHATAALVAADPTWTTVDVLHAAAEGSVQGAACPSRLPGVFLVAADLSLADKDTDASLGAEFALRASMAGLSGYDLVLIDCPPGAGRLTGTALIAATHALVVTSPTTLGVQGAQQVLSTLEVIRSLHRRQTRLAGVVVNSLPAAAREAQLTLQELGDEVAPAPVWAPAVPYVPGGRDLNGSRAVYDELHQRLNWLDPLYREQWPDRAPAGAARKPSSPSALERR